MCLAYISAKPENRCVVVTEAGSYLRLIDFCITQLKAQGPSRTCDESKEEEEDLEQLRNARLHSMCAEHSVQFRRGARFASWDQLAHGSPLSLSHTHATLSLTHTLS